jgi:hypothetical protein
MKTFFFFIRVIGARQRPQYFLHPLQSVDPIPAQNSCMGEAPALISTLPASSSLYKTPVWARRLN